jgi:glycine C-acetyltransferase
MLFSAGWLAGFGVIKCLVKSNDHVIMDALSHNCLIEGSRAATNNIHKVKHLCVDSNEAKIKEIREKYPDEGIFVITEGLFSMDADTTDLIKL